METTISISKPCAISCFFRCSNGNAASMQASGFRVLKEDLIKKASNRLVCYAKKSQPRGPLWRGRLLSRESVLVIQDLKRAKGNPEKLQQIMQQQVSRLLKKDLLEVLNDLQRQDECELALEIFGVARREIWYKPDVFLYRNLMETMGKNKLIHAVERLFKELQQEGIQPDMLLYTELIGAYVRSGMHIQAFEAYEEMKDLGYQLDQLGFRIFIRGLKKSEEQQLLDKVQADFWEAFPNNKPETEEQVDAEANQNQVKAETNENHDVDIDAKGGILGETTDILMHS